MKKKVLSAALSVVAFSGVASATQIGHSNQGDALVSPYYTVEGGASTTVRVVNSSPNTSMVLKFIAHEQANSAEVMDFLIFLSPNDTWEGTLRCSDANCTNLEVASKDESTPINGDCNQGFFTSNVESVLKSNVSLADKAFRNGYITLVQVWTTNPAAPNATGPVAKSSLCAPFNNAAANGLEFTNVNTVSGSTTVAFPGAGSMTIPLLAIADYDASVGTFGGWGGWLAGGNDSSYRRDVEAVLWGTDYVAQYSANESNYALLTWPTRHGYEGFATQWDYYYAGRNKFNLLDSVSLTSYDNQENVRGVTGCAISPCPTQPGQTTREVGLLALDQFKHTAGGSNGAGWIKITPRQVAGPFAGSTVTEVPGTVIRDTAGAPVVVAGKIAGSPAVVTTLSVRNVAGNGEWNWKYAPYTAYSTQVGAEQ